MNGIAFVIGIAALLLFLWEAKQTGGTARLRALPLGLALLTAAWLIQTSVQTTHTVVFHW